ncbi:DUF998 domain-containing protein [Pedobacter yulinensis]|uniref:DUF998 domain-containing protein n=1 Tax=Pedobacter yulinensis TaxID=2126353 RepID=A0A2T3HLP4_9SPHI|nr:DUF998 domain-containing protein [Pedobacter yulinensis]PST83360.1 DUF998 domain-containing protein [Pedobacter yulinensis]
MKDGDALSYRRLRKMVGVLGFCFPFALAFGSLLSGACTELQSSISGYYHTNMRDLFVGVLCVVAFFFFAYRAYSLADRLAAKLASVFALGVAFFPTGAIPPFDSCRLEPYRQDSLTGYIHYAAAALLFLDMVYFCFFLFTRSAPSAGTTPEKRKRNRVFRTCGAIILVCILLLALYFSTLDKCPAVVNLKPVLWLEAIALMAFGCSWLVKGELLLADRGLHADGR